jgi:hypothetical protein
MNEHNQLEQESNNLPRRSFLLRLWRTNRTANSSWHASLEDTRTNERVGFANPEQLFAFLMALIERDNKRGSESPSEKQSGEIRMNRQRRARTNPERGVEK